MEHTSEHGIIHMDGSGLVNAIVTNSTPITNENDAAMVESSNTLENSTPINNQNDVAMVETSKTLENFTTVTNENDADVVATSNTLKNSTTKSNDGAPTVAEIMNVAAPTVGETMNVAAPTVGETMNDAAPTVDETTNEIELKNLKRRKRESNVLTWNWDAIVEIESSEDDFEDDLKDDNEGDFMSMDNVKRSKSKRVSVLSRNKVYRLLDEPDEDDLFFI